MKDSLYFRILLILLAVCMLATVAHVIYAADAYTRASIIYFIGEEVW